MKPTAISKSLNGTLPALLGIRVIEASPHRTPLADDPDPEGLASPGSPRLIGLARETRTMHAHGGILAPMLSADPQSMRRLCAGPTGVSRDGTTEMRRVWLLQPRMNAVRPPVSAQMEPG